MEDNFEDDVVESTGFKQKCKNTFSKLVSSKEESPRSISPHPRKNSKSLRKNSKSPSRKPLYSKDDNNTSSSALKEKVVQHRSLSVDAYTVRPVSVARSRTASPRIVTNSSPINTSYLYSSFIVYVADDIIKISGANYNTLDLVQSGYRGIKIDNYGFEGECKYYYFLVYSKTHFGISDTIILHNSMGVDEVIVEFNKNFPIIIKTIGNRYEEDSFINVFLTIMFSIKEKRANLIEEKEQILESDKGSTKERLYAEEKDVEEIQ